MVPPPRRCRPSSDRCRACRWLQKHKAHVSSLSIISYGPGGANNVTSHQFNSELKAMG